MKISGKLQCDVARRIFFGKSKPWVQEEMESSCGSSILHITLFFSNDRSVYYAQKSEHCQTIFFVIYLIVVYRGYLRLKPRFTTFVL